MAIDPYPLQPLSSEWNPLDSGFISATYDPALAANAGGLTNGTVYFSALPIRTAALISRVWFIIGAASVTPTGGANFFGLYGPTGTLLSSVSADALVLGTGPTSGTLAVAQLVQPGIYYAAAVTNAATPPTFARQPASSAMGNANLSGAGLRFFHNGTALSALPASITLASNVSDAAIWAGVN